MSCHPATRTLAADQVPGPSAGGLASRATGRNDAWGGRRLFWYVYYGVTLGITLGVVLAASGAPSRQRAVATAALLAMAVWYGALGRRVTQDASAGARRETTYLLVLFGLYVVAEAQTGSSTFILLATCPQCYFASSSFRRADAFAVAFNVVAPIAAVFTVTGHGRGDTVAELTAIAALGVAFSIVFGHWISAIIDQSIERADLIERLESAQAELAAANREAGVLAERQRLASEIHDTIAQGFASIVMLIQAAEPEIGRDEQAARRYLAIAARTARENLAEARTLVAALTPAHLASGSLDDALR
ncbi:MAG: sensor histidine kinase, partial [Streptosporangiaceae bacterium]